MPRPVLLAVLLLASAAACEGAREPTESQLATRREARRDACVAEALQRRAHANLATLDTLMASSGQEGAAPSIVTAPHAFAAAYATYADLRAHEVAYRDSAFGAASREDSIRFERMAASFRVTRGSPSSLEANVQQDYAENFALARQDPEHVCNHLVAGGRRGRGN